MSIIASRSYSYYAFMTHFYKWFNDLFGFRVFIIQAFMVSPLLANF